MLCVVWVDGSGAAAPPHVSRGELPGGQDAELGGHREGDGADGAQRVDAAPLGRDVQLVHKVLVSRQKEWLASVKVV